MGQSEQKQCLERTKTHTYIFMHMWLDVRWRMSLQTLPNKERKHTLPFLSEMQCKATNWCREGSAELLKYTSQDRTMKPTFCKFQFEEKKDLSNNILGKISMTGSQENVKLNQRIHLSTLAPPECAGQTPWASTQCDAPQQHHWGSPPDWGCWLLSSLQISLPIYRRCQVEMNKQGLTRQ